MNNSKSEYGFWGFAVVVIDWEAFVKEVNLQHLEKMATIIAFGIAILIPGLRQVSLLRTI